ncbi:hypothetical protein [Exiguobacterium oxidotolerans]|uniref:Lipoprotein n=1 Tax=Exiguobacterium oxidotolerans TaxID=223958 RepID=A0A653IHZ5_9BACL|nr:hypothetical protein [Exiguobacterium oxidotolerans]VWX38654.1 conserved exported hypothetical protein [Exiguobacterium oxidotolerans]
MKRILSLALVVSLIPLSGCSDDTTRVSTTDTIAAEARQNKDADLIRINDRVYQLSDAPVTLTQADVKSFATVTKQLTANEPLAEGMATDWPAGTKLYRGDTTGVIYISEKNQTYMYEAIPEG